MKLVLFFIVCSSFVFAQNVGGSFFENSRRDITYGLWLDYSMGTGTVYVAEGDSGLRAYQQTGGFGGPINLLGVFNSGGSIYSVDVTGNYAYLAAGSAGLQVVDVSNPAVMSLTGSLANANLRVVLHEGNYVYAGSQTDLYIYNVSNPAAVTLTGSMTLPGDPKRFVLRDGWLYAALGSSGGGLLPVNVSNPAAPAAGTLITYQGFVYDVMKDEDGGHADLYVAEGVRYHRYDIFASTGTPVHLRSDSVGGKLSRMTWAGAVFGKDGQYIRAYDNARIAASKYTPGGSEFLYSPGSELLIYCGDSLFIGGFLFSGVDDPVQPDQYILHDNYPNPFNPSTTISFHLAEAGEVELRVYDMNGTEVRPALRQYHAAGSGSMVLEASRLASGVYFCQMRVNNFRAVKKLVLLR